MIALVISGSLALWLIALVASGRDRVHHDSLVVPIATAFVCGTTGLVFRLHGFSRSLWLDEFGTLWAIEDGFAQTIARVTGFHGQSPLYYLTVWPVIHWLGESEVLLRLPSFVFGLATAAIVYFACRLVAGRTAGLFGASVAWISVPMTAASANARPYALAMLFVALALYGFIGAVLHGRLRYRTCFIIGGAGLVLTHYIYSPLLVGVGVAYLIFNDLRHQYAWRAFVVDVAVQLGLAMIAAPQVLALWSRRESLVWIDTPNYFFFLAVLVPVAVPALAGLAARSPSRSAALESGLWLSVAAQIGSISVLSAAGTNLLVPRYLDVIVVPAAVLAGLSLARVRALARVIATGYLFVVTCLTALAIHESTGHFVVLPHEDWRGAVQTLQEALASRPGPVLYRSGFVEQATTSIGAGSALASPLRSPGHRFPDLSLISIPHSWSYVGADTDREAVVVNSLAERGRFYLLSGPGYAGRFLAWMDVRFRPEIVCRSLGNFGAVDLVRCGRDDVTAGSDSFKPEG